MRHFKGSSPNNSEAFTPYNGKGPIGSVSFVVYAQGT